MCSPSRAGDATRNSVPYIPIRGMVLTSSELMPAIAPSPACQPPLHSLQTAMPARRFILHGHSPILRAQRSQACFRQQPYSRLVVELYLGAPEQDASLADKIGLALRDFSSMVLSR